MFANPWWSVLVLLGLVVAYAVVRIKHGAPLLEAYSHLRGWEWFKAWLYAFRSWVFTAAGGLALALPDLAVAILPIDLSWLIGADYATRLTGLLTAYLAFNTFFKTKPDGVKAG